MMNILKGRGRWCWWWRCEEEEEDTDDDYKRYWRGRGQWWDIGRWRGWDDGDNEDGDPEKNGRNNHALERVNDDNDATEEDDDNKELEDDDDDDDDEDA